MIAKLPDFLNDNRTFLNIDENDYNFGLVVAVV